MTTTTIQVDTEVREELRARGRMGESYNDVIVRLLAATRPDSPGRTMKPDEAVPVAPELRVPLRQRA